MLVLLGVYMLSPLRAAPLLQRIVPLQRCYHFHRLIDGPDPQQKLGATELHPAPPKVPALTQRRRRVDRDVLKAAGGAIIRRYIGAVALTLAPHQDVHS